MEISFIPEILIYTISNGLIITKLSLISKRHSELVKKYHKSLFIRLNKSTDINEIINFSYLDFIIEREFHIDPINIIIVCQKYISEILITLAKYLFYYDKYSRIESDSEIITNIPVAYYLLAEDIVSNNSDDKIYYKFRSNLTKYFNKKKLDNKHEFIFSKLDMGKVYKLSLIMNKIEDFCMSDYDLFLFPFVINEDFVINKELRSEIVFYTQLFPYV